EKLVGARGVGGPGVVGEDEHLAAGTHDEGGEANVVERKAVGALEANHDLMRAGVEVITSGGTVHRCRVVFERVDAHHAPLDPGLLLPDMPAVYLANDLAVGALAGGADVGRNLDVAVR